MLSGLNTTGHEIGGSLGIAVLVTIATGAVGGGPAPPRCSAGAGQRTRRCLHGRRRHRRRRELVALVVLPSATSFLPKLRLAPSSMPIH